MTSRFKNGIFKPKVFLAIGELDSVEKALATPHWNTTTQEEYITLMNNQT